MASAEQEQARPPDDLAPKKGCTSVVWNYFGFRASDSDQKTVLCKQCRAKIATSKGNTTNLYQHLKKHHRSVYDKCIAAKSSKAAEVTSRTASVKAKQSSVTDSFAAVTPYDAGSRRRRDITKSIAYYLAKDMVPLNTVTKGGFKHLLQTLDKRYVVPSRTYFSQVALPEMYAECRKKVEIELKGADYYASTTDMWSSRTTEPYLCLTVHFISEEFELKSRCLQTSYFPDDHTGDNIALGLQEFLSSWSLDAKWQTCITTDNASNVIKAMEINKWTRLQCFGHRLHLAIGKLFSLAARASNKLTLLASSLPKR